MSGGYFGSKIRAIRPQASGSVLGIFQLWPEVDMQFRELREKVRADLSG
jgi:hypothetical protein